MGRNTEVRSRGRHKESYAWGQLAIVLRDPSSTSNTIDDSVNIIQFKLRQ
jgi:hypothetical protein